MEASLISQSSGPSTLRGLQENEALGNIPRVPKPSEGPRKKQRLIKSQGLEGNLVLGMDVKIEEVLEVAESTLVGRVRGKIFSSEFIKSWGKRNWQTDLMRDFRVLTLAKFWFSVHFDSKEAAKWVL